MARVMFAVFAQRVAVDRFNNLLDILNVIEELNLPPPPPDRLKAVLKNKKGALAVPMSFHLMIHWRRSNPTKPEGVANSRVTFIGPNGRKLGVSIQAVNLRPTTYMRGLINYNQLLIVGEGVYTAKIEIQTGTRWRKAGEASFFVRFNTRPAPTPPARVH